MILGGLNTVSQTLAGVYNQNNRIYADTLSRIASGKRIQRPSDDFVGFIRAQTMSTDVSGFEIVKQKLTEAKGIAEMMAQAGGVLAGIGLGFQKEVVLGKIEKCEFFRSVTPPSRLIIESKQLTLDENSSWTEMVITDEKGKVAQSKIMFAFLESFGVSGAKESIIFTDDFLNSYQLAKYKKSMQDAYE